MDMKYTVHDLEVMGSIPAQVELGVISTSVSVLPEHKNIVVLSDNQPSLDSSPNYLWTSCVNKYSYMGIQRHFVVFGFFHSHSVKVKSFEVTCFTSLICLPKRWTSCKCFQPLLYIYVKR